MKVNRRTWLAAAGLGTAALAVQHLYRRRDDRERAPSIWTTRVREMELSISSTGGVALEAGGDRFELESVYAYAGDAAQRIHLAVRTLEESEDGFTAEASRTTRGMSLRGARSPLTLERTISVERDQILVRDRLTNITSSAVGVLVMHSLQTDDRPEACYLAGAPAHPTGGVGRTLRSGLAHTLEMLGLRARRAVENIAEHPICVVSGELFSVSVVLEDDTSRLQASFSETSRGASFAMRRTLIRGHASIELEFTLRLHPANGSRWAVVNEVRTDWKGNFRLDGPFSFFDVLENESELRSPELLASLLETSKVHSLAFTPWLDYDNYDWRQRRFLSREEYRDLMRPALQAMRAVAPGTRCCGCLQTNLVQAPEALATILLADQSRLPGFHSCTDLEMRALKEKALPFADSLLVGPEGRFAFELYEAGPERRRAIAFVVGAALGNSYASAMAEQLRFLIDEVGFDGAYLDQFSHAFFDGGVQRFSYAVHDGRSAQLDPLTGRVHREFADLAIIGDQPRRALLDFASSRSATAIANTEPATRSMQGRPIIRFVEGWSAVAELNIPVGHKPPFVRWLAKGQLASPIALGYQPPRSWGEAVAEAPEAVMKCVLLYLRHGLVYAHVDFRTAGAASRLIQAMYPLTPRELGEGWIRGVERTITAVSGRFEFETQLQPTIKTFGPTGELHEVPTTIAGTPGAWSVELTQRDWADVSVIAS